MKTANILIFLLATLVGFTQEKKSKADDLFFAYSYDLAIKEYQKELRKYQLSEQQYLNLADSYLKTENYEKAAEYYEFVFRKDSILSDYYFNKMLQSISKTKGVARLNALMEMRNTSFSNSWIENADFNADLLERNVENDSKVEIFNVRANSKQSDFSPTFYNDKLLFTSSRTQEDKETYLPSGESYMDIFIGRLSPEGEMTNATPFNEITHSKYHEATPYYSKELESIFYVLSNATNGELLFNENGKNALAIGKEKIVGGFQFLLRDLSTSFYYPFYEGTSGKLFFAANFPDGYGGTDIYYVNTNAGQIMSSPVNLGPKINTPGNEIAPFIFENSLYFASDIYYGLGGMDIYKSNFIGNENFSIPVNLGKGINSTDDDFGLIIRNDEGAGLIGYFSSNRKGGKGSDDIYGFKVPEKPGLKTIALNGKVYNKITEVGVPGAKVKLIDKEGELIKEVLTDDEGMYSVEVPFQELITVSAEKERYSIYSESYAEEALQEVQQKSLDLGVSYLDDLVEEKEDQTVIKLNKFYFKKGSSTIDPEIEVELDKAVEVIANFPRLQLRIESHTDSRGSGSGNFRLSQARSNAIKNYLIKKGVSPSNILYTVGYGEDKILNNCTNGVFCLDVLHKKNERSLLVILNYDLLY